MIIDRAGLRHIPLSKPELDDEEAASVSEAISRVATRRQPKFTALSEQALAEIHQPARPMLVQSCTAALELALLLTGLNPGDEVVLPSYTFPSTANAVALRGAVPVFVDIRPDTLNIDEQLVEAAITSRTRAIIAVHYAGVAAEMDELSRIAKRHGLVLIEDAAQGLGASYKGAALGSIGAMGAISFHETKNVVSGEGGCLLVRDPSLWDRALVGRDKGTNKVAFQEKRVARYSWTGLGSAYAMHEFAAAILFAQLGKLESITTRRRKLWARYHRLLHPFAGSFGITLPTVPDECAHNGHIYYLLAPSPSARDAIIASLRAAGIEASFHYVPLHSADAGLRYGRAHGALERTTDCAGRLLRLPLFASLTESEQDFVIDQLAEALRKL